MVCAGYDATVYSGITGFLSYPTSCDPQFYAKIMVAIFIIIALSLYWKDRNKLVKTDFLSALGVSAIATIFLTLIGTLVGFITSEIFTQILVGGLVFITLWFFKR